MFKLRASPVPRASTSAATLHRRRTDYDARSMKEHFVFGGVGEATSSKHQHEIDLRGGNVDMNLQKMLVFR